MISLPSLRDIYPCPDHGDGVQTGELSSRSVLESALIQEPGAEFKRGRDRLPLFAQCRGHRPDDRSFEEVAVREEAPVVVRHRPDEGGCAHKLISFEVQAVVDKGLVEV